MKTFENMQMAATRLNQSQKPFFLRVILHYNG